MKSKIEKQPDGMWLIVDKGISGDPKSIDDGCAWAIEEDQVEPIRDACNEYLKKIKIIN